MADDRVPRKPDCAAATGPAGSLRVDAVFPLIGGHNCFPICSELRKAPAVLAVGDLHIASFGTWRDGFGRLIWGWMISKPIRCRIRAIWCD